jgi:lipopolysaccharide transport system ATP-binding protein
LQENIAIKIENLSKVYSIGKSKDGSLRGSLKSLITSNSKSVEEFWALKDVSCEINKGDVVGIIGKNGAGKSTLLKILSKITQPTGGRIEIEGRVASLLEVGTGFHPELTGRENIYLNGTILGMTRKEVAQKFDEIVAFSGIEKFIDTAVKHYSSGMYVRLAFAVAAHLEPEILIIDEVLAVGDAEFQKKCLGKMKDVAGQGRTVLFVSHQLSSVRQLCNKGILLESGGIIKVGEINEVLDAYQNTGFGVDSYEVIASVKDYFIKSVCFTDKKSEFFNTDVIRFTFEIGKNMPYNSSTLLLIQIMDEWDQILFSCETKIIEAKDIYTLEIPCQTLTKGRYKINCNLYNPGLLQYDSIIECCDFSIIDTADFFMHLDAYNIGKLYVNYNWK